MNPKQRLGVVAAAVVAALVLAVLLLSNRGGEQTAQPQATQQQQQQAQVSRIQIGRVLRLPVQYTGEGALAEDRLLLTAGAEDELPQGPNAFDVLPDGSIVIADPLRPRLAIFSADARYVRSHPMPFAPDQVNAAPDGSISARKASTGKWFQMSPKGEWSPAPAPAEEPDPSRLIAPDRAYIPGAGGGEGSGTSVVAASGERIASVEKLGADSKGGVYVSLELASRTDEVDVQRRVRKYGPGSALLAEIADVPTGHFVHPQHEFRLRDGRLYQLFPQKEEVRINIWDTNLVP